MRWLLFSSIALVAIFEGILLTNLPLFGIEIPITWLTIYLCLSKGWVGWRQSLVTTIVAGYLLDVIAAPSAGTVLVFLFAAWMLSFFILSRYNYSRESKLLGLVAGTLVYLFASFATSPFNPGIFTLLVWLALYLAVCITSYMLINTIVKVWLKRA